MVEKTVIVEDFDKVNVTPKMAAEWLENNHVNRRLRRKLVEAYRRDMENGRWRFTGEPIQFSRTNGLLNGQHRLSALAGATKVKSVPFLVVRGLEDDAQTLMDQGQSRNIRDAILIEKGEVKNIALVSSISRWMAITDMPGPHMTPNLMRNKVTAAEALVAYNTWPEIDIAASRVAWIRHYLSGSGTAMGYTWLAFHRVDPEANTEYWAGLVGMDFSYQKDPRKAAYRRIDIMHGDRELKTNLETAVMMISVFTRTWNAWRNQEEMDAVHVRSRSGIILPVKPI